MSEFIKDVKAHKGLLIIIATVALFLGMMTYYQVTNFHAFTANLVSQKFAAQAIRYDTMVNHSLFMDLCTTCHTGTVATLLQGELPAGMKLSGKNLIGTFQKAGTYVFTLQFDNEKKTFKYVVMDSAVK